MPVIILVSAVIQFAAAYLAFRMIGILRHVPGWILIAAALLLMGIRRMTTLLGYLLPGIDKSFRGAGAETIALVISILMLGSVLLIRGYFLRQNRQSAKLRESEQRYRELSDELEFRVKERTRTLVDTANRLQECSRVQSEFLGKMSHELRTPLNAVIGFSDILLSGMDGELTPEQNKDVQLVFNNARGLWRLIDNILDFSRLKNGRIVLHPEKVALSQTISSALADLRDQILEKGLRVAEKIPDDLPPVYADPARLHQILRNLIGNAVRFTRGGEIRVQAGWADRKGNALPAPPAQARGFVRVTVQDTGIGIPKKDLSRIFEGFQQSKSGPARTHEGAGLGLAITRSLVELHGGSMGVESQPGQGALLWFTLPTWEGPLTSTATTHTTA